MEHRPLGRTGVAVSKLCLGAMMFGAWGEPDHDESIRIIHAALDAGINFIDTADVYSGGESEEVVGKALSAGKRDDVVLATKVGFPMGDDLVDAVQHVIRQVDAGGGELGFQVLHGPRPDDGRGDRWVAQDERDGHLDQRGARLVRELGELFGRV